ncbi:hypothetical protein MOQ72_01445 [Saccharopolyspora sp. K220]|uniref:hypothetical protein n=1 Tax=Saccharopolyspora soli TaxID=2926618 RepID=UPI001F58B3B8|nr:hypothetical protein [Saccharopolyspora soli]MCI2416075.1 hypothetical protein [Saccharopolyspora soli]
MTTPDQLAKAAMHDLLLRLAGIAPDEVVAEARGWLAEDRLDDVASSVTFTAIRYSLPLTEEDLGLLMTVLEADRAKLTALRGIEPVRDDPPMVWRFSTQSPGDINDDSAVAALIDVLRAEPDAHGLWRTWRTPADDAPYPPPRAVYVVEADDGDLPALTARLQQALTSLGEVAPQIEVTPVRGDAPGYQRLARAYGALLWAATEAPEIKVARVFDSVDPTTGPSFDPDHPRILDAAERDQVLDYLRAGTALMVTTATLDDVVDTTRGLVVPMSLRTDGTWIWPDTVTYYLEHHHLQPEQELLAHIRNSGLLPPELDAVALHRAMEALREPPEPEPEPIWTTSNL